MLSVARVSLLYPFSVLVLYMSGCSVYFRSRVFNILHANLVSKLGFYPYSTFRFPCSVLGVLSVYERGNICVHINMYAFTYIYLRVRAILALSFPLFMFASVAAFFLSRRRPPLFIVASSILLLKSSS